MTRKFQLNDRVRKTRGSSWQGRVCGLYSTSLTPYGYCIESEREPGSVQNYPEGALEAVLDDEEEHRRHRDEAREWLAKTSHAEFNIWPFKENP